MRRTYVWDKATGKMVPKGATRIPHMGVLPDIKDFTTTDGVNINGRAGLREYQRRTGTEQIGNDCVNGLDAGGNLHNKPRELPPIEHTIREAWQRHNG